MVILSWAELEGVEQYVASQTSWLLCCLEPHAAAVQGPLVIPSQTDWRMPTEQQEEDCEALVWPQALLRELHIDRADPKSLG